VTRFLALPALVLVGLVTAGVLALAGCKQGEGERCQIDDDCASGLVCNQATQLCARPGSSGGIDAEPPIDAADVDAAIDAPIDAPEDAPR
jgi:hypothetical protein